MINPILNLWFKFPEKIRFLLVGGWNTVFAVTLFSLILELFQNYKIALVISHIISVFHTFINLRFFVFRANLKHDKNFWKEYFKVNIVYLFYFIFNFAFLWFFVEFLNIKPIISQIIITCLLLVFSYFSNKHFTFKDGKKKS